MKLTGDNIAVKMDPDKEVSDGGIMIPANAEKLRSRTGTVLIVGPGDYYQGHREPMTVEVGNRVLLAGGYGGVDLKFKGDKVRIVQESDVIAILEEGDEE